MTPTPVSHEVIDRPCSHTDRSRTTLRPGAEAVGTAVGESLGGARRGAEERGHGRGRGPEAKGGEEGERERESLIAMASHLLAMASHLLAMASNVSRL